jgi:hypothetical protein
MKIKRILLIFSIAFFLPKLSIEELSVGIGTSYAIPNNYHLSEEDIAYIKEIFKKRQYRDISKLPSVTPRPKVTEFFKILRVQNSDNWFSAYLLLLKIVPDLFIENELGC